AGLAAVPVLRTFRSQMDRVREDELARALKKLAHLAPDDRAAVDLFSRALMNKFLHEPASDCARRRRTDTVWRSWTRSGTCLRSSRRTATRSRMMCLTPRAADGATRPHHRRRGVHRIPRRTGLRGRRR